MTTDSVVPAEGRDLIIPSDTEYAELSYAELRAMETLRVAGFTLVSKDELLGVPHIITRVTYWMHLQDQLGMVSCEGTMADADTLQRAISRRWVPNVENIEQMRLEPNERFVYNDGGTGIRRQVTKILSQLGLIDVGRDDVEDDSRYDTPWTEWKGFKETRRQSKEIPVVPSFTRYERDGQQRPLLLCVDRGLTVSEYDNEYAKGAMTYYLR